jgi:hypothetical protein
LRLWQRGSLEVKLMIRQRFHTCVIALAAVLLMSACVSLRVTSDVAAGASASQCHTFGWAGSFHTDGNPRTVANPLNESRLRAAITANLAAKGVQPASGQADCLIGYGIGVHTVLAGGYPYYGWGGGWGWGWHGGYYGAWGWDGPYAYREGIVAVDLYDARSRQPLWHAFVDQNVEGLTGGAADQKIRAAVTAIFTKYPG